MSDEPTGASEQPAPTMPPHGSPEAPGGPGGPGGAAPPEQESPPKRTWLIAAVVAAAVLLLGALYLLNQSRSAPPVIVPVPVPVTTSAVEPTAAPGAVTVAVPDVVGDAQTGAESAIKDAGFVPLVYLTTTSAKPAGTVMAQMPAAGVQLEKGAQVAIQVAQASAPPKSTTSTVPKVTGMTQADAQSAITKAGLVAAFVTQANSAAKGTATAQQPSGGASAPSGSAVVVAISSGSAPAATTVTVPNVVGKSQSLAVSALSSADLGSQAFEQFSPSAAKGNVFQQWPPAGETVAPGTPVALIVSMGPETAGDSYVAVPDLRGKDATSAAQALADLGLESQQVPIADAEAPVGQVVGQLPAAGSTVPDGSTVLLGIAAPPAAQD